MPNHQMIMQVLRQGILCQKEMALYAELLPLSSDERCKFLRQKIDNLARLVVPDPGKSDWEAADTRVVELCGFLWVAFRDTVAGATESDLRKTFAETAYEIWRSLPMAGAWYNEEKATRPVFEEARKVLLKAIAEDWAHSKSETDAETRFAFLIEVISGKYSKVAKDALREAGKWAGIPRLLASMNQLKTLNPSQYREILDSMSRLLCISLLEKSGSDMAFLLSDFSSLIGKNNEGLFPRIKASPALRKAMLNQAMTVKELYDATLAFKAFLDRDYEIEVEEYKVQDWLVVVRLAQRGSLNTWRETPQDFLKRRLGEWATGEKGRGDLPQPLSVSVTFTQYQETFRFEVTKKGEVILIPQS